mmetsp:Transcript_20553/g.30327  ORF Transcript_20553/g.30327 Transcript_20553/m.30327 type:complete len:378 (-) Transcript_20553:802-1935(-)
MSDPNPSANLSLSLDDIIKQRRSEKKNEEKAKAAKKRTPIKSKENQQKSKPTTAQKATGSNKAKRDAQMAAKRGISQSPKPTKGHVEKEIYRQQRAEPGHQPARGNCSIFVGNLSYKTSWQNLKDHMRKVGNVDKATIIQGSDGRSKGCGIVVFQDARDAQRSVRELAESELDGRTIFISEDRDEQKVHHSTARPDLSVFVGNLAFETSWQDLKDHMRKAGNVENAKILEHPDGRSKGCGLVSYQQPKDAQRAVRQLHDSVLKGRPMTVRENREKTNTGNSNGGKRPDPPVGNNQVFVGNLGYATTWKSLKDLFASVGSVNRAEVIVGHDGKQKGFGIVTFFNPNDAEAAINRLNGAELDGRKLLVRYDERAPTMSR